MTKIGTNIGKAIAGGFGEIFWKADKLVCLQHLMERDSMQVTKMGATMRGKDRIKADNLKKVHLLLIQKNGSNRVLRDSSNSVMHFSHIPSISEEFQWPASQCRIYYLMEMRSEGGEGTKRKLKCLSADLKIKES